MKKLLLLALLICVIVLGLWFYQSYQTIGLKTSTNIIKNESNQTETPSENQSQTSTNSNQYFSLSITSPADGTIVNQPNITVTGKTAPLASVYINDIQLTADNTGNFSTKITLDEGENVIYILAHDNLGEAAEKEITVTLET